MEARLKCKADQIRSGSWASEQYLEAWVLGAFVQNCFRAETFSLQESLGGPDRLRVPMTAATGSEQLGSRERRGQPQHCVMQQVQPCYAMELVLCTANRAEAGCSIPLYVKLKQQESRFSEAPTAAGACFDS